MALVELQNDFHNTRCTVRTDLFVLEGYHEPVFVIRLTEQQEKRARKRLCRDKRCRCGGFRGEQKHKGRKLVIESDLYR